jgi:hypothetical protein
LPFTNFVIDKPIFVRDSANKAAVFLLREPHADKVVKIIPIHRPRSIENEAGLLRLAASLGISPKAHALTYGIRFAYLVMDHVPGPSLAELHGDPILNGAWFVDNLPEAHAEVCRMLRALAELGVAYPDRSAWQFVQVPGGGGRLVLLDLEHARRTSAEEAREELELIDTEPWNPEFA